MLISSLVAESLDFLCVFKFRLMRIQSEHRINGAMISAVGSNSNFQYIVFIFPLLAVVSGGTLRTEPFLQPPPSQ